MSLNDFMREKYTIKHGTKEYQRLTVFIAKGLEDIGEPTVLITKGKEVLQLPSPSGNSWQTTLQAEPITADIQISIDLLQDDGFDLAGYLTMAHGRVFGNYLRAELLDGTGDRFVRLAGDVTVERYVPEDAGDFPSSQRLVGFRATLYCDTARAA
jgi:hypothetical protein